MPTPAVAWLVLHGMVSLRRAWTGLHHLSHRSTACFFQSGFFGSILGQVRSIFYNSFFFKKIQNKLVSSPVTILPNTHFFLLRWENFRHNFAPIPALFQPTSPDQNISIIKNTSEDQNAKAVDILSDRQAPPREEDSSHGLSAAHYSPLRLCSALLPVPRNLFAIPAESPSPCRMGGSDALQSIVYARGSLRLLDQVRLSLRFFFSSSSCKVGMDEMSRCLIGLGFFYWIQRWLPLEVVYIDIEDSADGWWAWISHSEYPFLGCPRLGCAGEALASFVAVLVDVFSHNFAWLAEP
jgi:hypothetical protein